MYYIKQEEECDVAKLFTVSQMCSSYSCKIDSIHQTDNIVATRACAVATKTSASVLSGVPNTEKQMKARGRRPSAFIVSRCLEPLMKQEARVFGIAS